MQKNAGLRTPLFMLQGNNGHFYGGSQLMLEKKYEREVGCGIAASANLLEHIGAVKIGSIGDFVDFCSRLRRRFMPIIPKFGINGFALSLGLNVFFLREKLPYRVFWGVRGGKTFWDRVKKMLNDDIPVIMSIGPNFPNFFGKHNLNLFSKNENGAFAGKTFVITGTLKTAG